MTFSIRNFIRKEVWVLIKKIFVNLAYLYLIAKEQIKFNTNYRLVTHSQASPLRLHSKNTTCPVAS